MAILVAILATPGDRARPPSPRSEATQSSPVPHQVPPGAEALRTIVVAPSGPAQISEPSGPLSVELMKGGLPAAPITATVLSDENCTPDEQGISHCENRLRMADGSMMTVRHNHRMAEVSCLSPGEMVNVQTI